jgi:hypothetical protein
MGEDAMKIATLVPSCATFTSVVVACSRCGTDRRLVVSEPHSKNPDLELRTYHCASCEEQESYLVRL